MSCESKPAVDTVNNNPPLLSIGLSVLQRTPARRWTVSGKPWFRLLPDEPY
jgi:hypothetical protein